MKQFVDKCIYINFCNLCIYDYMIGFINLFSDNRKSTTQVSFLNVDTFNSVGYTTQSLPPAGSRVIYAIVFLVEIIFNQTLLQYGQDSIHSDILTTSNDCSLDHSSQESHGQVCDGIRQLKDGRSVGSPHYTYQNAMNNDI